MTALKTRARSALMYLAERLGLILKIMVADWIICSAGFMVAEGKGPITSLWWGIVTQSTTGYGDYSPETTLGRFFGGLLMVSMQALVPLLQAALVAYISTDLWTHDEQEQIKTDIAATKQDVAAIRTILANQNRVPE